MSPRRRRPDPRTTCEDCGELIEWVRDPADDGRARPLDYGHVSTGRRYAVRRDVLVRLDALDDGDGRTDHRDTCTARSHERFNPPDPRLPRDD